ncbi:MAG: hypothetical protein IPL26_07170 [Leptospiraceae bacterium]|nr:hypothetical protein [Leptospiraceae bacterium]
MKTLSIFKAKVIEVIDGDTFRGEVNLGFDIRITRSFRVYGIDAPEIFRPKSDMERVKGVLARDKASELLLDKEVEIRLRGSEKYGCSLVEVILPDNKPYAEVMREEGFDKSKGKRKQPILSFI